LEVLFFELAGFAGGGGIGEFELDEESFDGIGMGLFGAGDVLEDAAVVGFAEGRIDI